MRIGFFDLESNDIYERATKVHCMSLWIDQGDCRMETPHPMLFVGDDQIRTGMAMLEECDVIVAHNGYDMDYPLLDKLFYRLERPRREDTIVLSRLFDADIPTPKGGDNPHSLKSWGIRLKLHKGDYTGGWAEYNDEMGAYCQQDVRVLVALWNHLEKERRSHDWETAIRIEYGMSREFRQQADVGWYFLRDDAVALQGRLQARMQEIEAIVLPKLPLRPVEAGSCSKPFKKDGTLSKAAEAWLGDGRLVKAEGAYTHDDLDPRVAGPFSKLDWEPINLGSRDQLVTLLKAQGWQPTEFTDKGNPKLTEESLKHAAGETGTLLAERFMLEKRLALVTALIEGCRPDGKGGWRVPAGGVSITAVTGRAGHRLVTSIPRASTPYGKEIRSLFTVPPGREYVNADADSLEARMMAHDLNDPEFTKEIVSGKKEDGTDLHSKNVWRFGLDPSNPKARDGQAKPGLYAMIYGGGDEKLGHTVDVFGAPHEWYFHEKKQRLVDGKAEAFGKAMRDSFLTALPSYAKLVKRVKKAAKRGWIRGLDGRKLKVRSVHSAINTRFQANGNIVVKAATLKCLHEIRKRRIDALMVGHFHDEANFDCAPGTGKIVGQLWDASIKWAERYFKVRCPLAGSFAVGPNWAVH